MGNCLNCGQEITGNYCSNCGQKKYRRIDRKYIIEEAQYSLLHTNKGFLYSVKNILKNPGKTAREFIDGNRVNHYKPILLTFVLSGISAFFALKVIGLYESMEQISFSGKNVNASGMHKYTSFMTTYNSFLMLLLVPVFAFFTKLAFRKWGHNYFEHIVMNAFVLSLFNIINILFIYPLMYIFKSTPLTVASLSFLSILTMPFLFIWFLKDFYKGRKLSTIILRVVLMFGSLMMCYFGVILLIVILMVILDPEAIQQMQQAQQKT